MQPDEVRKLDNRYAILLLRGEPPMLDEKYDLLSHPNIKRTTDGGAPAYDHTLTPHAAEDIAADPERYEEYEFLTVDEILKPDKLYFQEGE